MRRLQPPGWPEPRGYANGIAAAGELIFVAGQIGWDETGAFPFDDLRRPGRARPCATSSPCWRRPGRPRARRAPDLVRHRPQGLPRPLPEIGAAYRDVLGRHFPAMAVVWSPRWSRPRRRSRSRRRRCCSSGTHLLQLRGKPV